MKLSDLIDDVVCVVGYELLGAKLHKLDIEVVRTNLEVDAFCMNMCDDYYLIEVNKKLRGDDLIRAVCHELVHVAQYVDGRLNGDNGIWMWEGANAEHFEYENQPWEIEAHDREDELVRLYKEATPA